MNFNSLTKFGLAALAATSATFTTTNIHFQVGPTISFSFAESEPRVYTWGSSQFGQLGHGDDKSQFSPTLVTGFEGMPFSQISMGGNISAVLTEDGELFTFGKGQDCSLGHNNDSNVAFPQQVIALSGVKVKFVDAGPAHMAAVTNEGKLYTWGRYWMGQLGRDYEDKGRIPSEVTALKGVKIVSVACGSNHTLALTEEGEVYSFGGGRQAALGHGNKKQADSPKLIEYFKKNNIKIVSVQAGSGFSLFLDSNGKVYSCGCDDYGQLGLGSGRRYQKIPALILTLNDEKIVAISCGDLHAAALTDKGEVYTWGFGKDGQTGHNDTSNLYLPRLVDALSEWKIQRIECGGGHTSAITENKVFIWGRGRSGQLGRGAALESVAAYRTMPLSVDDLENVNVRSMALGENHSGIIY